MAENAKNSYNEEPKELTDRELIEMYAKQKYAYDKFLESTNNLSAETLEKRDNRRAKIKSLKEEIDKRGISPQLSSQIDFSKKQRDEIEAKYLSGKDFKNYTFEQWTNEEKQINEKIKNIDTSLETCFDQDKANQLQKEKAKYKYQLLTCQKMGEKALDKQVTLEEKSQSTTPIVVEENIKEETTIVEQEAKSEPIIPTIVENDAQANYEDYVKQLFTEEQAKKQAEENTRKEIEEIVRKKAEEIEKIEAQIRERKIAEAKAKKEAQAKREAEEMAKMEAEKLAEKEAQMKAEMEANSKKGFWAKCKEKISKNWKKIVAPALAILAIGGTHAALNGSQEKEDNSKSNTSMSDEFIGPKQSNENFEDNKINDELNKESSENHDNREEQENDFRENLKVEEQLQNKFTLGDIVHIEEGCNYYENSLEGGRYNTIDTKNQWRPAGEYMIDGLAVTYQDNNGDWKIAKLKDDKTNGGNYGNLGLNSDEYVKSIMQENGLSEEQVRIMYHINQGTKVGEHPTGWIQAPQEGFKLESKYEKTQQDVKEVDELEKLS